MKLPALAVLFGWLFSITSAHASPPCDRDTGTGACSDPLLYGMAYSLTAASAISLTAVTIDTAVRAGRGRPTTRRDGIAEVANMVPVLFFGFLQLGMGAAPRTFNLSITRTYDPVLIGVGVAQITWAIGLTAHGAWAIQHGPEE